VFVTARRVAHEIEDALTGGYTSRHLRDIEMLMSRPELTAEFQQQKLSLLLDHARMSTSFYSAYKSSRELGEFPVVQKAVIKADVKKFASRDIGRIVPVFTSGSYGTPMTFGLSPEKARRRRAEAIYFNSLASYRVGMPYAVVQARVDLRHSHWKTLLQNELVVNVPSQSRTQLRLACDLLRTRGIQFVIGWPSVLAPLAAFSAAEGLKLPRMRGVISTGRSTCRSAVKTTSHARGNLHG